MKIFRIVKFNDIFDEENKVNSTTKNINTFRYSFKYFVNAGELQYNGETMTAIATNIVERSKTNGNYDIDVLISEAIQPIMYLLKREQNITEFCRQLKRLSPKGKNIQRVSQRLLIDIMMVNSDRLLRRRLTSLLSKRNAVPMIQPQFESMNSEYRSISNLIHVWDYHQPVLLSFAIGPCEGKTTLINTLFYSSFEQYIEDKYFSATIDVDFGYHIVERRPVNIADTHGQISAETFAQISPVFSGFLVHVNSKYLCSNESKVIKYLKLISPHKPVLLLIHNVSEDDDEEIQSIVENLRSGYPCLQIQCLPNVSDSNNDDKKDKIDELRGIIFGGSIQFQRLDEKLIQEHLKRLLDDTEREILQQENDFIDSIQSVLINSQKDNYVLYSLFTDLCQKRLEMANINPYNTTSQSKALYQLNLDLFDADSRFKELQRMDFHAYGAGFKEFFELLQDEESRFNKLYLLSTELKKQADKKKTDETNLPFYDKLSLDIHWRNVMIGSTYLPNRDQELLVQTYRDYIDQGNPFEIVDGDNFEMQSNFLAKVFELFPNKKFFVISINGPQNSGKSTLLNFLFGALFETQDGRCTKGKRKMRSTFNC